MAAVIGLAPVVLLSPEDAKALLRALGANTDTWQFTMDQYRRLDEQGVLQVVDALTTVAQRRPE